MIAYITGPDFLLLCRRAEKNSLEISLFEIQELAAQLEVQKEQLEGENQSLDQTRQVFQGKVHVLLPIPTCLLSMASAPELSTPGLSGAMPMSLALWYHRAPDPIACSRE